MARAMTSSLSASLCRNLSAGGQEEHPCDVNSSTTTGLSSACAGRDRIRAAAIQLSKCRMGDPRLVSGLSQSDSIWPAHRNNQSTFRETKVRLEKCIDC